MGRNSEMTVLLWEGPPSVAETLDAIERGRCVEIGLPVGMHHALFRHLNPEAPRGAPENFRAEGGAELVPRIATVAGLHSLADLEGPLRRAGYRVRLSCPDPMLVLMPPAA